MALQVNSTGPNSWSLCASGDLGTAFAALTQVASKRHFIKKISAMMGAHTIIIAQGTDATAEKTLLTLASAAASTSLVHEFIKPIPLDTNKSIIIDASTTGVSTVIIEGETI